VFLMCRKKPKSEPEAAPLCSLNYRYIIWIFSLIFNVFPATGYPSGPGYSSNLYNVDNLKLVSLLGQGK
jgi:hypothetical protein